MRVKDELNANAARRKRQRGGRCACGSVFVVDLVPAAARAQMLSQELAGMRRDQAHVQVIPLHLDALPEPSRRGADRRRRLRRSH